LPCWQEQLSEVFPTLACLVTLACTRTYSHLIRYNRIEGTCESVVHVDMTVSIIQHNTRQAKAHAPNLECRKSRDFDRQSGQALRRDDQGDLSLPALRLQPIPYICIVRSELYARDWSIVSRLFCLAILVDSLSPYRMSRRKCLAGPSEGGKFKSEESQDTFLPGKLSLSVSYLATLASPLERWSSIVLEIAPSPPPNSNTSHQHRECPAAKSCSSTPMTPSQITS